MNYWLILIILGAVCLVVGPIMLFKPSGRDRQLAHFRQQAAQNGIRVRLATSTAQGKEQTFAVYSLSLAEANKDSTEWLLLKRSLQHELHFYGEWDWHDRNQSASSQQQQSLKEIIDVLPEYIVGLELTSVTVGVWWKETGSSIESVEQILTKLVALSDA